MKAKDTTFTLKIEAELRERFMAVVAEEDRSASQVVRELMRDYIARREEEGEYDDFLRRKLEISRRQRDAGLHLSNEEVEAEAAARRADLLRRAKAAS